MKRKLFFALVIAPLLACSPSWAGLILDASGTAAYRVEGDGSGSVLTTSPVTVANNSNRILVMTVSSRQLDGINSISFGDQSFTQATSTNFNTNRGYGIFYLLNPDAESNAITVTTSGPVDADQGVAGGIVSLYNAVQEAPILSSYSEDNAVDPSEFTLTYALGAEAQDYYFVEGSTANSGGRTISSSPAGFNELINESGPLGMGITSFAGHQDGGVLSGTIDRTFEVGSNSQRFAAGLAIAAIPEPSTGLLTISGVLALMLLRRRRR